MNDSSANVLSFPAEEAPDALGEILRWGAQQLLGQAIQDEVSQYLSAREDLVDRQGRHQVVRNGYLPERTIQTPIGDVEIRQPRVRDRRQPDERESFTSNLLPPYLRKTRSMEELIPWLYLKGVSTGDFAEALQALLGPQAKGLSATTITRLKAGWQAEYEGWSRRSLRTKRYVYIWADGVYFNIRLASPEDKRQCILVLMGATVDGRKELIAIQDGIRESEASWSELLLEVKSHGLVEDPHLPIGDGAMGFWAALSKVYPTTLHQRCWVHKTANVLNCLPKSVQPRAKSKLHAIWQAETREDAIKAFDTFVQVYEDKYPKAVACLVKDQDEMLAFYDFPAKHWVHLRTTNPIESTFATVKLRTKKTKGSGSRAACLAMVYRLGLCAQNRWRALNGAKLMAEVVQGVKFENGVRKAA